MCTMHILTVPFTTVLRLYYLLCSPNCVRPSSVYSPACLSVAPAKRKRATSLDCRSYRSARSARSAEGLVDLTHSGRFRFFLPFTRFAETGATFYQLLKRHNSVFPDGVTSGAVISPDGKASWQVFTPLIAPRVVPLTRTRLSARRDDRHFFVVCYRWQA